MEAFRTREGMPATFAPNEVSWELKVVPMTCPLACSPDDDLLDYGRQLGGGTFVLSTSQVLASEERRVCGW